MRELEARDQRERDAGLPSSQRMRAIVSDAAKFIHILMRACQSKRMLEIGTSYGYSTLWWAWAAQAMGGHVDTIELYPERVKAAAEHFQRAGVSEVITPYQGDAHTIIKQLRDDYDLIFIDAEKDDYENFLDLSLTKVRRHGLIIADNVLSHADQLGGYIEKAQRTQGLFSVTVDVGRGEEVSLRVGEQGLPASVVATLAELEVYAKTHKHISLAVPRVAGKVLHILAVAVNAKSVIELGTSTGYSGVWLASAMQLTGGRVLTIEPDPAKIKIANESFAKAKVASHVGLVKGKALDVLQTLNGPFDFAFIDAIKEEYIAYVEQLWPKMRAGGLIIADNIDDLKEQLTPYVKHVQSREDAMSVSLHIGNGMELTLKSSQ
jgi:predicted O-methyltransferase YrrM